MSQPHINDIFARLPFSKKGSPDQMLQLSAVICLLISSKFLEKMYPGVQRLNEVIQSPFSYDDFIDMEQEILCVLNWELYIVTPFDVI